MLEHTGKLIIRTVGSSTAPIESYGIADHTIEPLFQAFERTPQVKESQTRWLLADPDSPSDEHPWDIAHEFAQRDDYRSYVEPDLVHHLEEPPYEIDATPPSGGINENWPPYKGAIPPGWHRDAEHANFDAVKDVATGDGVRIAHLDTGYSRQHESRPDKLLKDSGYNFYEGNKSAVDTGLGGILMQPGHGTATLAILAGKHLELEFGGKFFRGKFGGAPSAEVVPVRIHGSVVHLFTSSMARGIDYALAPRNTGQCDVITISAGGLPSLSWAAAVNHVYNAGIVTVAAAGNNYKFLGIHFPFHQAVWPSRFARVVTVLGATYEKTPYITGASGVMQGNWGPPEIMHKAIAAYTPNVAWMLFDTKREFVMSGGGTSSSTPQVAAACALWLEQNAGYAKDWKRVEACRQALFKSAEPAPAKYKKYLGCGYLNVPHMLSAAVNPGSLRKTLEDDVTFEPFQRLALSKGGGSRQKMLEVESAQVAYRSTSERFLLALQTALEKDGPNDIETSRELMRRLRLEPDVSSTLRAELAEI